MGHRSIDICYCSLHARQQQSVSQSASQPLHDPIACLTGHALLVARTATGLGCSCPTTSPHSPYCMYYTVAYVLYNTLLCTSMMQECPVRATASPRGIAVGPTSRSLMQDAFCALGSRGVTICSAPGLDLLLQRIPP